MSQRFLEPHYSALRGVPQEDLDRAISRLYGVPVRNGRPSRVEWLGVGQCTPYCRDPVDAKPYLYTVQNGDGMWVICKKFKPNCSGHENCKDGWGLLASVNAPWPGTILNGICVLNLNPGDQLKIPASWPDPQDYSNIVCPDGTPYDPAKGCPPPAGTQPTCANDGDCPSGQVCVGGKCVQLCPSKTQRIDPASGNCVDCPKGQQRDAKDYTKCVTAVATAGMSSAGLFLLAAGALSAIYMAVTQGGKGLASR